MEPTERKILLETGEWRQYIIDSARSWRGTPYQHKCRVKGVGADCGGLVYEVYNPLLGPFPPFPTDYAQDWAMHNEDTRYMDFIMPYVEEVSKPVPGGLAMFKVGRSYGHAAIVSEKNTFIHAWGRNQHGGVIESRLQFFTVGGKPREAKFYDVSKECR